MSTSSPFCIICSQRPAFASCLCFRSLKQVCSICIIFHIKESPSSHFILNLSFSASIEGKLEGYLEGDTITRPNPCLTGVTPRMFPGTPSPQNRYREHQIPDLNLLYKPSSSLLSDLEISLSKDGTPSMLSMDRYICGIHYTDQKLLIHDIHKKTTRRISLPIYTDNAHLFKLNSHHEILLKCIFRDPERLEVFYYNINRGRFVYLPLLSLPILFEEIIHHKHFIYYSGSTKRLKIMNLYTFRYSKLPKIFLSSTRLTTIAYKNSIYFFKRTSETVSILNTNTLNSYEIQFYYKKRNEFIDLVLSFKDIICIITNKYTYIYSSSLNLISRTIRNVSLSSILIDCYTILGNDLYLYYNSFQRYEKFKLFYEKPSKTKTSEYYSDNNSTRYIYMKGTMNYCFRVDFKHGKALAIRMPTHKLSHTCDLPDNQFLYIEEGQWKIYRQFSYESYLVHQDIKVPYNCCFCWWGNNVYAFSKHAVFKFDIETRSWNVALNKIPTNNRKHACCVYVEGRIYIIGGGIMQVSMYDVENNSYFSKVARVPSKSAIAKVVRGKVYVIWNRGYQVYSSDFKLMECWEYEEVGYEVQLASRIGCFDQKIYFYNDSIKALEYLDLRTRKRKVKILEYVYMFDRQFLL
jgi:hypothetical protein